MFRAMLLIKKILLHKVHTKFITFVFKNLLENMVRIVKKQNWLTKID